MANRYPALELGQAGNPACPNKPTEESSLLCPSTRRLLIQVAANAAFIQLGTMLPQARGQSLAACVWQPPIPLEVGSGVLHVGCDAVRAYNYVSGSEAQVLVSPL